MTARARLACVCGVAGVAGQGSALAQGLYMVSKALEQTSPKPSAKALVDAAHTRERREGATTQTKVIHTSDHKTNSFALLKPARKSNIIQKECNQNSDTLQTKVRHNSDTIQTKLRHNADTN